MRGVQRACRVLASAATLGMALAGGTLTAGQRHGRMGRGPRRAPQHPARASRPTTDRGGEAESGARPGRTQRSSARPRPATCGRFCEALGVPVESQLLRSRRPACSAPSPARTTRAPSSYDEVGRRRLRAGRAGPRARGPRSPARGGVLHARSGGRRRRSSRARPVASTVPRVGEHAERARRHRAAATPWRTMAA